IRADIWSAPRTKWLKRSTESTAWIGGVAGRGFKKIFRWNRWWKAMKGSTGGSRVVLNPEKLRTRRAMRYKQWTPQGLRSTGSYWQARILGTAVHLELFDWLGNSGRNARAATKHFGGTGGGWEIFLDALSAMGLLRKRALNYENSPFALRYLCSGKGSFLLSDYDAWN